MKIKPYCFLLAFTLGCHAHPTTLQQSTESPKNISNTGDKSSTNDFRRFLAKFQTTELPLIIKPLDEQEMYDRRPLIYGADSIFIQTEYKDTSLDKVYAYRILSDTTNSFKVIWIEPAEILIPVLSTFSKSGKRISQETLTVGQCGTDCCYTCNETIIINRDLTIYAADSIRSCTCDSLGPRKNTMKKYVLMKTGRISSDGAIQLSTMTKKPE